MRLELKVTGIAWRNLSLVALTACLMLTLADMPRASEAITESPASPNAVAVPAVHVPKDDYCANIADLAADARYALQMKTLEDLQAKIDQKISLLEAKRAESEAFLKKRNDAIKETRQDLVEIFSKMKPDVAAAQFEILDVETSASILKQLNARVAGTILNEMKAPIAAAITVKMAQPISGEKLDGGI
jgi:flagellar motility protein MotE (MotC chaperone)